MRHGWKNTCPWRFQPPCLSEGLVISIWDGISRRPGSHWNQQKLGQSHSGNPQQTNTSEQQGILKWEVGRKENLGWCQAYQRCYQAGISFWSWQSTQQLDVLSLLNTPLQHISCSTQAVDIPLFSHSIPGLCAFFSFQPMQTSLFLEESFQFL